MYRMRLLLASASLILALLAAGCGGSGSAGGAAAVAPADSIAYVWLDSDRGSEEWRAALAVVDRLPGARRALGEGVARALATLGPNGRKELEAALGPELVLVALRGGRTVALTRPRDRGALERLLRRLPSSLVSSELEGWTALGERQSDLDAFRQALARGRLEQDELFRELTGKLPAGALVRVFARASELAALASSRAKGVPGLPGAGALGPFAGADVALALSAEREGIRISGVARSRRGDLGTSYAPTLLERVPADARIAVSFRGSDALLAAVRQAGGGTGAAKRFEDLLGVPLERVARLFVGEGLLFVRRGATVPEATIVLRPADAAAGEQTLVDLARSLARRTGLRLSTARERGVEVTRIGSGGAALALGRLGDLLVATTATGGPASLGAAGQPLTADPGFMAAAKLAGFKGRTSGLLYVHPAGLLALVDGTGNGGAVPPAVRGGLGALGSILLQTEADGTTAKVTAFVRVP